MKVRHTFHLLLSILILTLILSACEGVTEPEPTPQPTVEAATATPAPTTPTTAATETVAGTPAEQATETAVAPTPTSQPEATPTEVPPTETPAPQAGEVVVAYVAQGDVYLWTSEAGPQRLTTDGGVDDVKLSPDGQLIALRREGHLWVINSDGSQARQLTDEETFSDIDFGDLADDVTGVGLYQMAWLPGTHSLIFNTMPRGNFVGLILTDDLWRADVDSGEVRNVLGRGEGGNFVVSPDGSQLALISPDSIDLLAADGSNRRNVLTYSPVLTYSEYRYYASPVWAPDGGSLAIAIPPADPLADPPQPTEIWRIDADDGSSQLLGAVDASGIRSLANVLISPVLTQVAFLQEPQPGAAAELMLAPLDDQVGQATLYAQSVQELNGWSPDGAWFAFSPQGEATPALALGQPGAEARPIGSAERVATSLQWADGQHFVFVLQTESGWDIVLLDVQGNGELVAAVPGEAPALDVVAR